ncbi:Detected protein of confused Function [Hibiscus syriacus]|uniref:Detected protein of confused Function n=1 Tax=Hibiscus syriacus TaxID=106335 RepID=A0A6A3D1W9_HIBSY|nr:Detected protein of confused Function [Hibiscus syriacus]
MNGWHRVVSSPVMGLPDIEVSQVLNITYLNPSDHKHIPRPPQGVVLPKKLARERALVPGAAIGPQLGEAAHRLVKSTLNVKLNRSTSSSTEQPPSFNISSNYCSIRPRPAGPPDYERGFLDDPNYYYCSQPRPAGPSSYGRGYGNGTNYYGQYNHPQGILGNPRHPSPNGMQIRNNFRSAHKVSSKMPNSGYSQNLDLWSENTGTPPTPPNTRISKPVSVNNTRKQENTSSGAYEKQKKKVYQIKSRPRGVTAPVNQQ